MNKKELIKYVDAAITATEKEFKKQPERFLSEYPFRDAIFRNFVIKFKDKIRSGDIGIGREVKTGNKKNSPRLDLGVKEKDNCVFGIEVKCNRPKTRLSDLKRDMKIDAKKISGFIKNVKQKGYVLYFNNYDFLDKNKVSELESIDLPQGIEIKIFQCRDEIIKKMRKTIWFAEYCEDHWHEL